MKRSMFAPSDTYPDTYLDTYLDACLRNVPFVKSLALRNIPQSKHAFQKG